MKGLGLADFILRCEKAMSFRTFTFATLNTIAIRKRIGLGLIISLSLIPTTLVAQSSPKVSGKEALARKLAGLEETAPSNRVAQNLNYYQPAQPLNKPSSNRPYKIATLHTPTPKLGQQGSGTRQFPSNPVEQQGSPLYQTVEMPFEVERIETSGQAQPAFENRITPTPTDRGDEVVRVPQDNYEVFPIGSDHRGYSTTPNLFARNPSCCDEWASIAKNKHPDYKVSGQCGTLKLSPGHLGLPWLKGCDNCEKTRGQGIQAPCSCGCLDRHRDHVENKLDCIKCQKPQVIHDRGIQAESGCDCPTCNSCR